jgi:hypothetical protein
MAPVGYDAEAHLNFFIVVALEPVPAVEALELAFCLVEVSPDGTEKPYWSGLDVAQFINAIDRACILDVVLQSVKTLIDIVKPAQIRRVTRDANLPPGGLEKHYAISGLLEDMGYTVHRYDVYNGKYCWCMTRE